MIIACAAMASLITPSPPLHAHVSHDEPGAATDPTDPLSSDDAALSFEAAFEALGEPEPLTSVLPGAVDLSAIDPPTGARLIRSLGTGVASYYGRRFHGRLTANGERFDMNALTAAHKTLPFGTHVRVTHRATGRSVTVRINDRGPFIRGRSIDLSRAAAKRIGLIKRGHARVKLDIVAP